MRRLLVVVVVVLASVPALAGQEEKIRALAEGAKPAEARIGDVAWLAGQWVGQAMGGTSEEIWTAPRAGAMMGMFRQVGEKGVVFYEILTLAEVDESLVLRIKHFGPDLKGWEEKDEVESFPLVAIDETTAYFDGVTYRKEADGGLVVWVKAEEKGEKPKELEFRFRPVAPPRSFAASSTAKPSSRPDTTASRIVLTRVPGRLAPGESYRCAGELVVAEGWELAGPPDLVLSRDGIALEPVPVPGLAAGRMGTLSFEVELTAAEEPGTYTIVPTARIREKGGASGEAVLVRGEPADFAVGR
jgi:hypothetical protein